MSNQEIQRVAEFHVFERNLYQMPQRAPLANGILDPRLVRAPFQPRLACLAASRRCWSLLFPALQGTTDKKGECQTCKGKLADCGGHYGARRRHNRLPAGLSNFFFATRRLHSPRAACLPRRVFQEHHRHPAVRVQDVCARHGARRRAAAVPAPLPQPTDGGASPSPLQRTPGRHAEAGTRR